MQGGCGEGGQGGPHSHQALTCLASSRVVSVHVRGPRPKQGCSALGAPGGVWAAGSEAGQHPCARSRSLRSGGTAPAGGRVLPGPSSLGAAAWSPHPPPRPWLPGRGGDAGGTVRCQANGPRGGDANVWDLHEQVPVLNVPLFPGGGRGAAGSRVRHAPLEPTPILRGTGRIQPGHPSPRPPGKGLGVGSALQGDPQPLGLSGPSPPPPAMQQSALWPLTPPYTQGSPWNGCGLGPRRVAEGSPPPTAPGTSQPPASHAASRTPGCEAAPPLRPPALLPRRRAPHSCPHPGADCRGHLPACLLPGAPARCHSPRSRWRLPTERAPGSQLCSSSSPPTGPAPGQPIP